MNIPDYITNICGLDRWIAGVLNTVMYDPTGEHDMIAMAHCSAVHIFTMKEEKKDSARNLSDDADELHNHFTRPFHMQQTGSNIGLDPHSRSVPAQVLLITTSAR